MPPGEDSATIHRLKPKNLMEVTGTQLVYVHRKKNASGKQDTHPGASTIMSHASMSLKCRYKDRRLSL